LITTTVNYSKLVSAYESPSHIRCGSIITSLLGFLLVGGPLGADETDLQKQVADLITLDKLNSQLEQLNARHIQLGNQRRKVLQQYRNIETRRDKLRAKVHAKPKGKEGSQGEGK